MKKLLISLALGWGMLTAGSVALAQAPAARRPLQLQQVHPADARCSGCARGLPPSLRPSLR